MKETTVHDIAERCRRGEFSAYVSGREIILEDRAGNAAFIGELRAGELRCPATPRNRPIRGERARTFEGGTVFEREEDEEGPYRGFLLVQCSGCGAIRGFCAKTPTYGHRCEVCGEETALEGMKRLFLRCRKCGKEFRYLTNCTGKRVSYPCLGCGEVAEMKLNRSGTTYVPVQGGK